MLADLPAGSFASLGSDLATSPGFFADSRWTARDCAGFIEALGPVAREARDRRASLYLLTEV